MPVLGLDVLQQVVESCRSLDITSGVVEAGC
jgi:hypothetical protein